MAIIDIRTGELPIEMPLGSILIEVRDRPGEKPRMIGWPKGTTFHNPDGSEAKATLSVPGTSWWLSILLIGRQFVCTWTVDWNGHLLEKHVFLSDDT